ncbi:MAG: cation transporter, partial [Clostridia bacterium]|nr:cation transporter [Clostridia bacterium]
PEPARIPAVTQRVVIGGMMCEHCEATIKKALEAIPGVRSAEASHEKGEAILEASHEIDEAALRKAVEDQMYEFKSASVI